MKLTKKVVAGFLTAAMLLTSSIGVFAAPSTTPVQSADAYYVVNKDGDTILTTPAFEKLKEEEPEVATMIEKANKGEITVTELADEMEAWLENADVSEESRALTEEAIKTIREENLDFVTPFFELEPVGDVQKNENGMYEPTIKVSALTKEMKNIKILHFSSERKCYEMITPKNVDYDNKTITFEVKDLSPIAILADKETITESATNGTSPKTEGTNSAWMMLMGAAFVLVAVGSVVVYSKKKEM